MLARWSVKALNDHGRAVRSRRSACTQALFPTRLGVRRLLGSGYRAEAPSTQWNRRLEIPFSFIVAA